MVLTWRSNRAGDLWAAYLGGCRVGYAAESLEAAQAAAARAVGEWVAAAGLCSVALPADEGTGAVSSAK